MIKIEKKTIGNKPFFYLTEQINIGGGYKKIQVYIGKNIPNNLSKIFKLDKTLDINQYKKIEEIRIQLKYLMKKLTTYQNETLWRKFATKFIFESNAIEDSKLSEKEVDAIVRKKNNKSSEKRRLLKLIILSKLLN